MSRLRYREEFWPDVAEVVIFDRFRYAERKGFALSARYVPIVGLRGAEVPRAVPRLAAAAAAAWKPGAPCETGGHCGPSVAACRLLRQRERCRMDGRASSCETALSAIRTIAPRPRSAPRASRASAPRASALRAYALLSRSLGGLVPVVEDAGGGADDRAEHYDACA